MYSKRSFSENIPFKSDTVSLSALPHGQQVPVGSDRGTSGSNRRLHVSVWEPRMPLRRAGLRTGERTGRLQSTEAVWDSWSGTLHSGSDSRRQTAHGVGVQC